MTLIGKINQIERLDSLIRRRATGSAAELALKFNISERNVFQLLSLMKEMGAPMYYCKASNSYCYSKTVKFNFGFYHIEDYRQVKGGTFKQRPHFFNQTARFLQWLNL